MKALLLADHGQGWGLLQVLQEIDDSQSDPLMAFAEAAEAVITRCYAE